MGPTLTKAQRRLASLAGQIRARLATDLPLGNASSASPKIGRLKLFRAYLAAEELSGILERSGCAGKRMLDIGGAFGVHSGFFKERHPDLEIDLLDLQPGPVPLIHTGPYETFV